MSLEKNTLVLNGLFLGDRNVATALLNRPMLLKLGDMVGFGLITLLLGWDS